MFLIMIMMRKGVRRDSSMNNQLIIIMRVLRVNINNVMLMISTLRAP